MRLRLLKLQGEDLEVQKLKDAKFVVKKRKNINRVLHYQSFFYVLEIIYLKLISRHQNNFLVEYFGIDKI